MTYANGEDSQALLQCVLTPIFELKSGSALPLPPSTEVISFFHLHAPAMYLL